MRHLVELLLEAGETQHVSSIINCFVNRGYHNVDTSIRRGGSDQTGWADKGLAKNGLLPSSSVTQATKANYFQFNLSSFALYLTLTVLASSATGTSGKPSSQDYQHD